VWSITSASLESIEKRAGTEPWNNGGIVARSVPIAFRVSYSASNSSAVRDFYFVQRFRRESAKLPEMCETLVKSNRQDKDIHPIHLRRTLKD
jgi:hypothetical protein